MDEEDIAIAQRNANENYQEFESSFPASLAKKEDALFQKLSEHKGNTNTKLRFLYDVMDQLYRQVDKLAACKKGCDGCCHYAVSITDPEIQFIESGTGIKRQKIFGAKQNFHGTPCPFLKSGACSIYQYRPFACRKHVAMTKTSYWCQPVRAFEHSFTMLTFSEVDRSFRMLISQTGETESFDIRQVFSQK